MALVLPSAGAAQAEPRRVLLLYSYERDFAPHLAFIRQFRPELSRRSAEPLEFIEMSLQSVRTIGTAPDDALAGRIQTMLSGRQPDLVVPIGGPAAVFAQRNRQQLFPASAMLLAGVDRRFVQPTAATGNQTAVAVDHEPARLVDNILNVLPDTRRVFVVVGASRLGQIWLDELKSQFKRFEGRITFEWANELSFAEMVKRCAGLPPHSAILFAILSLDAAGVPQVEDHALTELHAAANAPIFGLRSTQLGGGIVGGPLLSVEELSQNTASVALRLLAGEPAGSLQTPVQALAHPAFDERELRRWHIDERLLPSGSSIQFRQLSMWQQYRRPIAVVLVLAASQAILVVGLVASLGRRRRSERSLRECEGRLNTLSNAPVMLWMAGADATRTDFNDAWRQFVGGSTPGGDASAWTDAIHPDDADRCVDTCAQAVARREPFRIEYRLRRQDGEYRWLLETGAPQFFPDGSLSGYVGSAIDVTELKLARVALSSLNRRLMQAQDRERAAVARELQDALCQRMVVLTVQLHGLSQQPDGGDDEALRGTAADLSREFGDLASEIFSLAGQLSSSTVELIGIVQAARAFCRDTSAAYGVQVEFEADNAPSGVSSDISVPLFGVLQEAVRNAVTHSGAARVKVRLTGDDREVRLDVEDEGVGFDPAAVMRGPGLGLITMKERLGVVDGECAIESRPGAGTRVRVRVPLRSRTA